MSGDEYSRFRSGLAVLFVLSVLVGAVWHGSLVLFGIALVMALLWLDDRRNQRQPGQDRGR